MSNNTKTLNKIMMIAPLFTREVAIAELPKSGFVTTKTNARISAAINEYAERWIFRLVAPNTTICAASSNLFNSKCKVAVDASVMVTITPRKPNISWLTKFFRKLLLSSDSTHGAQTDIVTRLPIETSSAHMDAVLLTADDHRCQAPYSRERLLAITGSICDYSPLFLFCR